MEKVVIGIVEKHIRQGSQDVDAATKGLMEKGKDFVPAMRAMLHEDRLVRAVDSLDLRAPRRKAVDSAIVQLEWSFDPVAAIEKWTAGQKMPGDGKTDEEQPLKLQNKPEHLILDEKAAALLPGYLIYTSHFEPVPGGAALRVGAGKAQPAAQHYVFTVDTKGNVESIDKNTAVNFLIQNLPPIKGAEAAKDALTLWLRLCEQFVGQGSMLFEIDRDGMKTQQTARGFMVNGRSVVKVSNSLMKDSGQVDAQMTFGPKELGAATFTDNTKRGIVPPQP